MLTEIFSDSVHMSQLYSTVLCNLIYGELIQAKVKRESSKKLIHQSHDDRTIELFDSEQYFSNYLSKTYFKTASMISLGCRGIALLYKMNDESHRALFNFGAHLGIAF